MSRSCCCAGDRSRDWLVEHPPRLRHCVAARGPRYRVACGDRDRVPARLCPTGCAARHRVPPKLEEGNLDPRLAAADHHARAGMDSVAHAKSSGAIRPCAPSSRSRAARDATIQTDPSWRVFRSLKPQEEWPKGLTRRNGQGSERAAQSEFLGVRFNFSHISEQHRGSRLRCEGENSVKSSPPSRGAGGLSKAVKSEIAEVPGNPIRACSICWAAQPGDPDRPCESGPLRFSVGESMRSSSRVGGGGHSRYESR